MTVQHLSTCAAVHQIVKIDSGLWVFGLDKVSRSQCFYVRKDDDLTSR